MRANGRVEIMSINFFELCSTSRSCFSKTTIHSRRFPFRVKADGNCLYNACALGLIGNEDKSLTLLLRLLTSMELFVHAEHYLEYFNQIFTSQDGQTQTKAHFLNAILSMESGDKVTKPAFYSEYPTAFRHESLLNCKTGKWSSLVCVAALSSVLNHSIKVLYSPPRNVRLFSVFTPYKFAPRCSTSSAKDTILLMSTTEKL